MSAEGTTVDCPVCGKQFSADNISTHVNLCLNKSGEPQPQQVLTKATLKRKSTSDWEFMTKSRGLARKSCGVGNMVDTAKRNKTSESKSGHSTYEDSIDLTTLESKSKYYSEDTDNKRTTSSLNLKAHLRNLDGPLADKIRPLCFEDYKGQAKAVGKDSLFHSLLIKTHNIPSIILWGPPGCGKTTLAKIIAHRYKNNGSIKFVILSATSASVGDVKEVAKVAQNDLKLLKRRTILFLDEIHRFNKLQQDALLPHIENGVITLIGATTENPSFHVNNALLSRCKVIPLDKLQKEDLKNILKRACSKMGISIKGQSTLETDDKEPKNEHQCEQEFSFDTKTTNGSTTLSIEAAAIDVLSGLVDGDARAALNSLQMTAQAKLAEESGADVFITVEDVKEGLQKSHVLYDRNGEEHYNIASALIKSMRGSDDSAALYWLARMLEGGEAPLFVARRLVVFASEDVGLADPNALSLAVSTYQACHLIGMPECGINLAHCVTYLARAPKSAEAYTAYLAAKDCVRKHEGPLPSVPLHLRNASTDLMRKMGYGKGYKYPPAFEGKVKQDYLPPDLVGTNFFSFMEGVRPRDCLPG